MADRIKKGPIPLDEALPIAKQIAEALEAAHEAGVIHRDLKPANIKVRDDGTVKVLDFGLAKALDPSPTGDPSQSPTLTAAATQMGVIMGTAAYMSPEQASGETADKRSDIWSFGVVLFEMLTGQRLFTGKTVAHVMAKVLDRELDLTVLPATTPPSIRRLLRRCLQREPKRRLRDVGEALSDLEEAASSSVPRQHPVPLATELCPLRCFYGVSPAIPAPQKDLLDGSCVRRSIAQEPRPPSESSGEPCGSLQGGSCAMSDTASPGGPRPIITGDPPGRACSEIRAIRPGGSV